jgi:hypothetical protein
MRENILPELSNFYCHPGKAGGSPRAFRISLCGRRGWAGLLGGGESCYKQEE